MSATNETSPHRARSESWRAALERRARVYFGSGNTVAMTAVSLAKDAVALVDDQRMWLYEEGPAGRRRGITFRLTDKRRRDLLAALNGSDR